MMRPAPPAAGSNSSRAHAAGFTLVELLISMVVMSIVMVGVANFFAAFKRATMQEELTAGLEANLRVAMEHLAFNLRNARSGVPQTNLAAWIPWVTGFTANPLITQGAGSNPDSVTLAFCTPTPIATVGGLLAVVAGSTTFTLSSTGAVNTQDRRLIRIGDNEFAHVTGVGAGSTITIDTNPSTSGNQGLTRGYTVGTPICRVDVLTFDVSAETFRINEHQGANAQPAVDGITNLQIAINGPRHTITVSGRSDKKDPDTRSYLTRDLVSTITLRN